MLADTLRELRGLQLRDEDGEVQIVELEPPATDAEIHKLESRLPSPIPSDIRAALAVSTGFANSPLESFSLIGLEGFGLEDVFPFAYSIAHDGYGNYWVVDLHADSKAWAPVFYACHDPPVIVYQSATIEAFARDTIEMWQPGRRSPVDVVHEDASMHIWRQNPDLIKQPDAARSPDPELRAFAATVAPDFEISDLRRAKMGDGFSWGRYGPTTRIERHATAPMWAIARPPTLSRIRHFLFGRARQ